MEVKYIDKSDKQRKPNALLFYREDDEASKLMGAVLTKVNKLHTELVFSRIDTLADVEMTTKCGVSHVPCFVVLDGDGSELSRRYGVMPIRGVMDLLGIKPQRASKKKGFNGI